MYSPKMPSCCCVIGCTMSSKKNRGLTFHGLPLNLALREVWISKIRLGKPASLYSKVCSLHFQETDFLTARTTDVITRNRLLKEGAVPSINLPVSMYLKPAEDDGSRTHAVGRLNPSNLGVLRIAIMPKANTTSAQRSIASPASIRLHHATSVTSVASNSRSAQVPLPVALNVYPSNPKINRKLFSVGIMSEEQILCFTGFTGVQFAALWRFVSERFEPFNESFLSSHDQLLLVLLNMRLNMSPKTLGVSFGVREDTATAIFHHWVHGMYVAFKELDFWSNSKRAQGEYDMIIDCAEISVEPSNNPIVCQAMLSTTKHGYSLKALIGVSESGKALYCSPLYGGATSDRDIVMLSGFLENVKSGQHILADRRFLIGDLLHLKNAALNIPPPQRRSDAGISVLNCKVFLEQMVREAKNYAILANTVPNSLRSVMDEIFYVIFHFVNFM